MGTGVQACIADFEKMIKTVRLLGELEGTVKAQNLGTQAQREQAVENTDRMVDLLVRKYELILNLTMEITEKAALHGAAFDWQAAYNSIPCGS